jgi:hypothetical protein
MVDIEDVDAIVEATSRVAGAAVEELALVRERGRTTAEQNSYVSLTPRWRDLLDGFVALSEAPA